MQWRIEVGLTSTSGQPQRATAHAWKEGSSFGAAPELSLVLAWLVRLSLGTPCGHASCLSQITKRLCYIRETAGLLARHFGLSMPYACSNYSAGLPVTPAPMPTSRVGPDSPENGTFDAPIGMDV